MSNDKFATAVMSEDERAEAKQYFNNWKIQILKYRRTIEVAYIEGYATACRVKTDTINYWYRRLNLVSEELKAQTARAERLEDNLLEAVTKLDNYTNRHNAAVDKLLKPLDNILCGYAGMFGHDKMSPEREAWERVPGIIERAIIDYHKACK